MSSQTFRGLLILVLVAELISLVSLLGIRGGGLAPGVLMVGTFAAGSLLSLLASLRTPREPLALGMLLAHIGLVGVYVLFQAAGDARKWWGQRADAASAEDRRRQEQLVDSISQLLAQRPADALAALRDHDALPLDSVPVLTRLLCALGERAPEPALVQELRHHQARDAELLAAAARCSARSVAALLDAGVAPDAGTKDGLTALMLGTNPDALSLLLDRGASVNRRAQDGRTPLMFHRSPAVTALLLQRGGDPKAVDKMGNTALHFDGPADILPACFELLLAAGAAPNARNWEYEHYTPLHLFAWRRGEEEGSWSSAAAAVLVRHGANPFVETTPGRNAFELLIHEDRDLAPILQWPDLKFGDAAGSRLLVFAIDHSKWQALEVLLRAGANPALPDEEGIVPLQHYASTREGGPYYYQLKHAAARLQKAP